MWVLGGLGICIALLVAVAIVVFIVLSRQLDRDLAAVDAHIPTIEAAIAGDARFEGIELDSYTAHAGSLSVDGYVLRQADVNALQAIIAGTAPPRPVDYHVNVLTAEQIERNVRLGLFGPATTQPGGPLAPPAAAATAVYRITLTNEAGEIASGELKLPDPPADRRSRVFGDLAAGTGGFDAGGSRASVG